MVKRHRIATLILLSSTAAVAGPPAHAPPDDAKAKPALLKLRGEMFSLPRDKALEQLPRFRALCDADGYPLVGNIATKGDGDRLQPSGLCEQVRRPKSKT